MVDNVASFNQTIDLSIIINTSPAKVWEAITNPALMKQWMFESEIEIITDWKIGNSMIIRGHMHSTSFENTGTVLKYKHLQNLKYSHLSSLSELPNVSENYTCIEFELTPKEDQTVLALTLSNFPSKEIYYHFAFYWSVTLEVLKKYIEQKSL